MSASISDSITAPMALLQEAAVTDVRRVITALCYLELGDLVTPDCPFCFCRHKHRVPNLQPLQTKHNNSDFIPYITGMATKVSDCQTPVHTYALELRDKEEVPIEVKKMCKGTTSKGAACKRKAKLGSCVCLQHNVQLKGIAEKRWLELTT